MPAGSGGIVPCPHLSSEVNSLSCDQQKRPFGTCKPGSRWGRSHKPSERERKCGCKCEWNTMTGVLFHSETTKSGSVGEVRHSLWCGTYYTHNTINNDDNGYTKVHQLRSEQHNDTMSVHVILGLMLLTGSMIHRRGFMMCKIRWTETPRTWVSWRNAIWMRLKEETRAGNPKSQSRAPIMAGSLCSNN